MARAAPASARVISDSASGYRALVCYLSCARPEYIRRYAPHYMGFCRGSGGFDFLVSLDGSDPPSLRICSDFGIPLLFSDEREGVGIAKNRVLKEFPTYDYYFFIEDDAELLCCRVFRECIAVSEAGNFFHLSLFSREGFRGVVRRRAVAGHEVVLARYGGAQFSFFTKQGLEAIGGWHPEFASLRRHGHTEHSQRFVNQGLAEAAFVVVTDLCDCLLWHSPPSVSRRDPSGLNPDSQLSLAEEALIHRHLRHVAVETPSPYRRNEHPVDCSAGPWLDRLAGERYPLLNRAERRRAWADYYLALSTHHRALWEWLFLVRAGLLSPRSAELRHAIKRKLFRHHPRRAGRPSAPDAG